MKELKETHMKGFLSIESEIKDSKICDFGIQIAEDGRVWICINGVSFIRFKPLGKEFNKRIMKGETNDKRNIKEIQGVNG